MLTFKSTAFLASLVTCGVVICSTAYYAQSTAIELGLLSDRQLSEIYGGSEVDCEGTEHTEGCPEATSDGAINVTAKALDWEPPVKGEGETTEQFSQRYLASRPKCPDDINADVTLGSSAKGDDAEEDGDPQHCLYMYPYNRSNVVENAVAGGDFGAKTKCVSDSASTRHCVVCEVGDKQTRGEPVQKYKCPENNGE